MDANEVEEYLGKAEDGERNYLTEIIKDLDLERIEPLYEQKLEKIKELCEKVNGKELALSILDIIDGYGPYMETIAE